MFAFPVRPTSGAVRDEQRQPKRHTQFSRATRSKRILDRLREGWAYDEVAREEALTERRVRQIVAARFARPLALQAAPT